MRSREILEDRKGLTLVELLITIGILLVLAISAVPIYGNLQVSSQIDEVETQMKQTLRLAKIKSIAGINDSAHGIYFNISSIPHSYTLYQGDTYASRDINYDRKITFDDILAISTTISGDEINYSKGLGVPSNTGTVTITHIVEGVRKVFVNGKGSVE